MSLNEKLPFSFKDISGPLFFSVRCNIVTALMGWRRCAFKPHPHRRGVIHFVLRAPFNFSPARKHQKNMENVGS